MTYNSVTHAKREDNDASHRTTALANLIPILCHQSYMKAEIEWHKGPALGGVGTAGTENGISQWYDGDHLLIIVDTDNGGNPVREIATVYINADEDLFEVRDASTHDIYDAWGPESWSWWAKLDGKMPE